MDDRKRAALVRRALRLLERDRRADAVKVLAGLLRDLEPPAPSGAPALGPVVPGGRSILLEDLTHETGGLPGFPAFDAGFGHPGLAVLAPELLTVTKIGRAVRRDGSPDGKSVHATGRSGLRYWIGHVENVPAIGAKIAKGKRLATISPNHEVPHVHVGINADSVLGHELEHHTDYTHGAPTLGAQLAK